VLGVADSIGGLSLFGLANDSTSPQFEQLHNVQTTDPSILCLSLDWSNRVKYETVIHVHKSAAVS
jgi:hypothetical protein